MADETVTIHAARRDRFGEQLWFQFQDGGYWWNGGAGEISEEALEADFGPTRPVRVSTVDPARDAVIEAAKAWCENIGDLEGSEPTDWETWLIAAVDRLAGTGPPATPESPPAAELADTIHPDTRAANAAFMAARDAAEQATPAPQDTTKAVGRCGSLRAQGDRLEAHGADLQRQLDDLQALAGLSAEQEIRKAAAELYWNGSPGTWTLQDIVDWIKDGTEPADV